MSNWISQNPDFLPDFIIGGAMKCGTTTLHQILDKHPKVFIPKGELHFFDIDNILQHSDFNYFEENKWISQSMNKNPKILWDWYQDKFSFSNNTVKGEDSTTYLASRVAAERIAIQKKEIKLIFLLRQPSLRTYSNYNHLLRTGRATYSFEDTIRFSPFTVLNRSLYKEQLEVYFRLIPKERIKIILFEDLVENPKKIVKEVSDFINISFEEFPADVFDTHSNKGKEPRNNKLQARKNLILRNVGNTLYNTKLPYKPTQKGNTFPLFTKAVNKVHSLANPLSPTNSRINPETKKFLDDYFYQELVGLDELLEMQTLKKWFPEKF